MYRVVSKQTLVLAVDSAMAYKLAPGLLVHRPETWRTQTRQSFVDERSLWKSRSPAEKSQPVVRTKNLRLDKLKKVRGTA